MSRVGVTFTAAVLTAAILARVVLVAAILAAMLAGCQQDAIDANQQQLQAQQAELDQLRQQVESLQNQHPTYGTAAAVPGACDSAVMSEATRKGGERMAAGDTTAALGYYQDAVAACPTSAQAQLNLANTYEMTGDRAAATEHYRIAAGATGTDADLGAIQKAKEALSRMGSSS